MSQPNPIKRAMLYLLLGGIALVTLMPLLLTLINSFMSETEILKRYGSIFGKHSAVVQLTTVPSQATLFAYYQVLLQRPDYLYKLWVSLAISVSIVMGQVLIGASGGYAFAKFKFPLKNFFFAIIIILMLMPNQVTIVSNYIVLDRMGLIGRYWAVILPGAFSAFGVFLSRQMFMSVPDELLLSARVDGANQWQVLTKVVLPSVKAGVASLVILVFIDSWNMVEQPLIMLRDAYKYPLSVFLAQVNQTEPSVAFACGILSMLPVLLLYFYFDDELILGIEYSVIK